MLLFMWGGGVGEEEVLHCSTEDEFQHGWCLDLFWGIFQPAVLSISEVHKRVVSKRVVLADVPLHTKR